MLREDSRDRLADCVPLHDALLHCLYWLVGVDCSRLSTAAELFSPVLPPPFPLPLGAVSNDVRPAPVIASAAAVGEQQQLCSLDSFSPSSPAPAPARCLVPIRRPTTTGRRPLRWTQSANNQCQIPIYITATNNTSIIKEEETKVGGLFFLAIT